MTLVMWTDWGAYRVITKGKGEVSRVFKIFNPWLVWLSWLEGHPVHGKAVGSISGQRTDLGCRIDPQSGHVQEATTQCFSVFLSLSLSLSLPPQPLLHSLKSMKTCPRVKIKK